MENTLNLVLATRIYTDKLLPTVHYPQIEGVNYALQRLGAFRNRSHRL